MFDAEHDQFNITVLASGNGTTFQAIIDSINREILPARVNFLISNRRDAGCLDRAKNEGIPFLYLPYDKKKINSRSEYESMLLQRIVAQSTTTNLIVLAGWMHVLGEKFISTCTQQFNIPIINLHPALPGMFPGKDAIKQAFEAFQENKINYTGCMVHHVIPEIDAGAVISKCMVPIMKNDTYDSLARRVQTMEKPLVIQAIMKIRIDMMMIRKNEREISNRVEILDRMVDSNLNSVRLRDKYRIKTGKVRDIWDLGFNLLAMVHTNRFSSFDRHICEIPYKGKVLNYTSAFWFEGTRKSIIDNHMVHYQDNIMIVKKCEVIPLEVVLRAYITGSTNTSLWTHYSRGEREYCGLRFPDGLQKNQKLPQIVITPTTKDDIHDELISTREIIEKGLCSASDWNYICDKAIMLFKYASSTVKERGFILVDTKLEFGRDLSDGRIILIDEAFTCDSSRYWKKESYLERLERGVHPENLDKDIIRDFIKSKCDPYSVEQLPEIPTELIERVKRTYINFYNNLVQPKINIAYDYYSEKTDIRVTNGLMENPEKMIQNYFEFIYEPSVIIISDVEKREIFNSNGIDIISKLNKELNKFNQVVKNYDLNTEIEDLIQYVKNEHRHHIVFICSNEFLVKLVNNYSKVPVLLCGSESDVRQVCQQVTRIFELL